jgi:hypothetical protein
MPKLNCPFRLLTSHGRNEVGFASKQEFHVAGNFSVSKATCLVLSFESLSLQFSGGSSHSLSLKAANSSKLELVKFVDKLETALTTYFGVQNKNPYYGTPYVEFDRFNLKCLDDAPAQDLTNPNKINLRSSLFTKFSKKSIENLIFSSNSIEELSFNGLLQLYADGLRATSAQSKFFHWFIILEEFLEKNKQLTQNFAGLFRKNEIEVLKNFSKSLASERKKSTILSAMNQTAMPRHEKLAEILRRIGIEKLTIMRDTIDVTAELCQTLINQRHSLFHRRWQAPTDWSNSYVVNPVVLGWF